MRTDFYVGLLIGFIVGFAIGAVIVSEASDPCSGAHSIWNYDGTFTWGRVVQPTPSPDPRPIRGLGRESMDQLFEGK